MKPALFHDFLVRMGGAENVLYTFSTLFPEAPIYTFFYDKEKVEKAFPGLSKRIIPHPFGQKLFSFVSYLPLPKNFTTKIFIRLFPRIVEEIDLTNYDLIIASSTAWGHGLVPPSHAKFVVYIHSPMRFAWDWYNEYKQELGVKKQNSLRNLILTYILSPIRLWDQVAFKKESLLLCNSKTVINRVKKFYKRKDAQLLYPPVDVQNIPKPQKTATNQGYFLILSTLTKYKRIDIVIELFNKLGKQLYIVGDGPYREFLELKAEKNIIFLGYVDQKKKIELLQNARALIFPSEDDFGITPIESFAAGTPVIALNKGGAREYIVPGTTGEFFEEQTMDSLERGLALFLSREELFQPLVLRAKAEEYSTEKFIKNFRAILKNKFSIDILTKN